MADDRDYSQGRRSNQDDSGSESEDEEETTFRGYIITPDETRILMNQIRRINPDRSKDYRLFNLVQDHIRNNYTKFPIATIRERLIQRKINEISRGNLPVKSSSSTGPFRGSSSDEDESSSEDEERPNSRLRTDNPDDSSSSEDESSSDEDERLEVSRLTRYNAAKDKGLIEEFGNQLGPGEYIKIMRQIKTILEDIHDPTLRPGPIMQQEIIRQARVILNFGIRQGRLRASEPDSEKIKFTIKDYSGKALELIEDEFRKFLDRKSGEPIPKKNELSEKYKFWSEYVAAVRNGTAELGIMFRAPVSRELKKILDKKSQVYIKKHKMECAIRVTKFTVESDQIAYVDQVKIPKSASWIGMILKENGLAHFYPGILRYIQILELRKKSALEGIFRNYHDYLGKTLCVIVNTEADYQEIQETKAALERFRELIQEHFDEPSTRLIFESDTLTRVNGQPVANLFSPGIFGKFRDLFNKKNAPYPEGFTVKVINRQDPGISNGIRTFIKYGGTITDIIKKLPTFPILSLNLVSNRLQRILNQIRDFTVEAVDQTEFAFDRVNLALESDFFEGLFISDVGRAKRPTSIKTKYSSEVIEQFYNWLYFKASNFELKDLEELYELAKEFIVPRLFDSLSQTLAQHLGNISDLGDIVARIVGEIPDGDIKSRTYLIELNDSLN